MKKLLIFSLSCLLGIFILAHTGESKLKSYYNGDALNFRGQLYVASTNSDSLELFRLEGGDLLRIAKTRPFDPKFLTYGKFNAVKLSSENNSLYVYAVSGPTLYKYLLAYDNSLELVFSQKNTYYEWYNTLDFFGDNLATISDKGVKIWNSDLEVIDGYQLPADHAYSISSDLNPYILTIADGHVHVFSRETRSEITSFPINYKDKDASRHVSQDPNGNIYVMDDYYAKKFDLDGRLLASFRHLDYTGYDTALSGDGQFLYVSNGAGLVKLKTSDLSEEDYRYTWSQNGWAMKLKEVSLDGDKLVLFNNSRIMVLDENLDEIASFWADEEAEETIKESLSLNLNHYFGAPRAKITVSGTGFLPKESLSISLGEVKFEAKADNKGRFSSEISVPQMKAGYSDIKVDGLMSGLTYSTSFKVLE
jgi:hypothetical protein